MGVLTLKVLLLEVFVRAAHSLNWSTRFRWKTWNCSESCNLDASLRLAHSASKRDFRSASVHQLEKEIERDTKREREREREGEREREREGERERETDCQQTSMSLIEGTERVMVLLDFCFQM